MKNLILAFVFVLAFSTIVSAQDTFPRPFPAQSSEVPVDSHVNPLAFKALELRVENNEQQIATLKTELGDIKVLVVNMGEQLSKLQDTVARLHPIRSNVDSATEVLTPDQLPVVEPDEVPPSNFVTEDACADGSCGSSYYQSNSSRRIVYRRFGIRRR